MWEVAVPMVVVGRSGDAAREVNLAACRADGVPVFHRRSGGGAVVLSPGCLNYTVRLDWERFPGLRDVRASYRRILGAVIDALAVPCLEICGVCDLALDGLKVSGNAQHRDANGLLHHGTLLYAFDARLAARYLMYPPRAPAYRSGRDHGEFLGNLPLTAGEIRDRLARLVLEG